VGNLETKYKMKEYGLTFTEKWNTSNILCTELALQDFLRQGTKFAAETSFSPQTGEKSLKLKSQYKNDTIAVNADSDFKSATPILNVSAVFGYKGWLSGYQLRFDSKDSKVKGNNLALGYATNDFILNTNVRDGKHFSGSIFQKANSRLDTGIELAWSSDNNDTKFAIGCNYKLDSDASLKAKVNNTSQIGLGYSQKLRQGITLNLSLLVDGKNFNQGGHKIGCGIELEP